MIIESEISEIGFIRDSPTKGEKRITTREALKLNSKVLWVRCHKTKIAIAHELRSFFYSSNIMFGVRGRYQRNARSCLFMSA